MVFLEDLGGREDRRRPSPRRARGTSPFPASRHMPSPFPGMNPFLERDDVWPDFHHRLIDRMADAVVDQVDPRYLVKIEERLYVQESPGLPHRAGPRADVGINPSGPLATLEPSIAVLD